MRRRDFFKRILGGAAAVAVPELEAKEPTEEIITCDTRSMADISLTGFRFVPSDTAASGDGGYFVVGDKFDRDIAIAIRDSYEADRKET